MKRICLLFVFLCFAVTLFAQRTYEGQYELSAYGFVLADQGAALQFGRYTHNGYWDFVAQAHFYDEYGDGASSLDNSNVGDWFVGGGYMFRLLGTRERALSLYAGIDGFAGYEKIQRWYEDGMVGSPEENASGLAFGVSPKVELEVYPFKKLAFLVSGGAPMNFLSEKQMFRVSFGVGARYCF